MEASAKRKRLAVRPIRRWENNIKMNRRELGVGDMDWLYLIQDRSHWRVVVDTVMNILTLQNVGKSLSN